MNQVPPEPQARYSAYVDERLRQLEREAATGDVQAQAKLLGELSEERAESQGAAA